MLLFSYNFFYRRRTHAYTVSALTSHGFPATPGAGARPRRPGRPAGPFPRRPRAPAKRNLPRRPADCAEPQPRCRAAPVFGQGMGRAGGGKKDRTQPFAATTPISPTREGEGGEESKGRLRFSRHLPAPPLPRLPGAVSILIPRADGASAAKCWRDAAGRGPGCGRRGACLAWGLRARPRTRPHPRR